MDVLYENRSTAIYSDMGSTALTRIIHLHKELEVIHVKKGQSVAHADKNSYLLNAGDTFITFPNQVHYYETIREGDYMVLIFSPNIIYAFGSEISKSIPESNFIPAGDPELVHIFDKIRTVSGKYSELALSGYFNLLMSIILPRLTLKTVDTEKNSSLYSIVDYCTHHFREEITLDVVSENLHLSKYYISHLINKTLNQNFNEYINNLRISEACNLLKESDIKIADISEDVGFGTIRSFNRSFKQIMDLSPAQYRSKIQSLKRLI